MARLFAFRNERIDALSVFHRIVFRMRLPIGFPVDVPTADVVRIACLLPDAPTRPFTVGGGVSPAGSPCGAVTYVPHEFIRWTREEDLPAANMEFRNVNAVVDIENNIFFLGENRPVFRIRPRPDNIRILAQQPIDGVQRPFGHRAVYRQRLAIGMKAVSINILQQFSLLRMLLKDFRIRRQTDFVFRRGRLRDDGKLRVGNLLHPMPQFIRGMPDRHVRIVANDDFCTG